MPSLSIYAKFVERLAKKEIALNSDVFKVMLLSSSYSPNISTDDLKSSIVANELANGNGYVTGGQLLTGVSLTLVTANSFVDTRANSTAYLLGDIRRPAVGNGHLYRCTQAGTSAGSAPSFPLVSGMTVTDGGVVWAECGTDVVSWKADSPVWTSATFTARYAVIYDDTHASDVLTALYDPGISMSPVSSALLLPFPSSGIWCYTVN